MNKLRKKFLNIFIVILVCILIIFFFDYLEYKLYVNKLDENYIKNYPPESYFSLLFTNRKQVQATSFFEQNFEDIKGVFRTNIYNTTNNPKDSIIVFGCSFGYGTGLEDKDTFSNKIAKLTGRNIYNLALCGCGTQHIYRILQNDDILREISNTPSHAIYVYISDHIGRISYSYFPNYITTTENNLNYKLNGNNLVRKTFPPFIHKMILFKKLITYIEQKNESSLEFKYNNFAIMNELLLKSKKELEEKYPNIKFVILRYQYENDAKNLELPFMWDILEKEGFTIINSKDLAGKIFTQEYTIEDKVHPNAQVWDLIVPKLVEKLNL